MGLNKNKLTNKIWYQDELWTLDRVISPNKYQDFLLLSIEPGETTKEDVSNTVYMAVVDAGDDMFFPNTKEVREIMKKRTKAKKILDGHRECLVDAWLSVVGDA